MAYRKPPRGYSAEDDPSRLPKLRPIAPWEHVARMYPSSEDRVSLTYGLRQEYRLRVLA